MIQQNFGSSLPKYLHGIYKRDFDELNESFQAVASEQNLSLSDFLCQKILSEIDDVRSSGQPSRDQRHRIDLCIRKLIQISDDEGPRLDNQRIVKLTESVPFMTQYAGRQMLRYLGLHISKNQKKLSYGDRKLLTPLLQEQAIQFQSQFWLHLESSLLLIEVSTNHLKEEIFDHLWSQDYSKRDKIFQRAYILERGKKSDKIWNLLIQNDILSRDIKDEYLQMRLVDLLAFRQLDLEDMLNRKVLFDSSLVTTIFYLMRPQTPNSSLSGTIHNFLRECRNRDLPCQLRILHLIKDLCQHHLETDVTQMGNKDFFQSLLDFSIDMYKTGLPQHQRLASWIITFVKHRMRKPKCTFLRDCYAINQYDAKQQLTEIPAAIGLGENEKLTLLAMSTYDSFDGYIVRQRESIRIRFGYRPKFALWRMIAEIRKPSANKRQGRPHWFARHWLGTIKLPSARLCEQVTTEAPGEPVQNQTTGDWCPWLPLVSDFFMSLKTKKELIIRTIEGTTRISRPNHLLTRLKAYCLMTWKISLLCDLRLHHRQETILDSSYIKFYRSIGFQIEFSESSFLPQPNNYILSAFKET
ncbi:MAG: hypothetical protein HRU19_23950 [Pseudobacteriovorax sp.]|nr:hypothetical protein [Pseudobacteriovorax sp.]